MKRVSQAFTIEDTHSLPGIVLKKTPHPMRFFFLTNVQFKRNYGLFHGVVGRAERNRKKRNLISLPPRSLVDF